MLTLTPFFNLLPSFFCSLIYINRLVFRQLSLKLLQLLQTDFLIFIKVTFPRFDKSLIISFEQTLKNNKLVLDSSQIMEPPHQYSQEYSRCLEGLDRLVAKIKPDSSSKMKSVIVALFTQDD